MSNPLYRGIWPVVPTPFNEDGSIDYEGQKRVLDCMIDQGSDGLCILANYSEQMVMSDEERKTLTELCFEHVANRVPIMVTCSHFSTDIVEARWLQGEKTSLKELAEKYGVSLERIRQVEAKAFKTMQPFLQAE